MKKIITTSNPFILLMLPIALAMVMSISHQFKQKNPADKGTSYTPATSLFNKSVTLFKSISAVSKQSEW